MQWTRDPLRLDASLIDRCAFAVGEKCMRRRRAGFPTMVGSRRECEFDVFVLLAPPPFACGLPGRIPVPASSEHPPHQQSPRPSSISPKNSTIPAPRRRGRNSRAATATRIHLAAAAVGSRVAPALPAAADGPEPAVGGIATDRDRGRNRNI